MEVVWRWARGEQFSEIMNYTDVDEGTIVRYGLLFWDNVLVFVGVLPLYFVLFLLYSIIEH